MSEAQGGAEGARHARPDHAHAPQEQRHAAQERQEQPATFHSHLRWLCDQSNSAELPGRNRLYLYQRLGR